MEFVLSHKRSTFVAIASNGRFGIPAFGRWRLYPHTYIYYVTDQLSIIRGKRLEKRPYFPMISLQRSCLRVSTAVYVTSDHAVELYNLKSGC